jgi:D-alanyl-lipoteichoic acid acyltransferase DltB (MBOAT superfamily)
VLWRLWALAPPALQWQRSWRPFRIAITFCLVLIGWLMFRETDVHHLGALLQLSPFIATADQWWLGLYFLLLAGFIALPILIHTAAEGWASRHWVQLSDRRRWALQAALLALMTILVVFFRSTQGSDFIYFQF